MESKGMSEEQLKKRVEELEAGVTKAINDKMLEQADKRDACDPKSTDWQVYNQGVFVCGSIVRSLAALLNKEKKDG